MKTDPRISQVMAIGDRRAYLVALITVAPEIAAGKSETDIYQMVDGIVRKTNEDLSSYERIKKFRILPKDLTQAAVTLTPTLKLKRKVVLDKFGHLVEEM